MASKQESRVRTTVLIVLITFPFPCRMPLQIPWPSSWHPGDWWSSPLCCTCPWNCRNKRPQCSSFPNVVTKAHFIIRRTAFQRGGGGVFFPYLANNFLVECVILHISSDQVSHTFSLHHFEQSQKGWNQGSIQWATTGPCQRGDKIYLSSPVLGLIITTKSWTKVS